MLPIGTCMTPNLHKCKLKKTQGHSSQFQRWWHPQTHHPSVNTPFLSLQLHMHGCTILCAYLCWHSYFLRGECIHFWKFVGLCKWWFAQVGDTHLQGATPFLHFAGLPERHQPLHPLALANDFQVWDLNTSVKIVCKCTPCFIGFRPHIISKPTLYLMCLKLAGSFDSYMLLT